MATRGQSVLEEFPVEKVQDLFIEAYGRVVVVADMMNCSVRTIYDLLDIYPEIVEARAIGTRRKRNLKIETAEQVLQKMLDRVDTEADLAARQAQFILRYAKDSPYNNTTNNNPLEEERDNAKSLIGEIRQQIQSD